MIEGRIQKKDRVIIIDDVVTTGGSAMDAVKAVEAQGCTVVKVVPLIDRNEGGRECFKDYDYDPIITINEIFELEAATNRNTKTDIKTNLVNANQQFSAVI
ncbi:MAG: hypothetical protein JRF37_10275 [Deltaproteobacteria bacterium]|nr:hypothetical protein [Deltaproteobacteria bacterium]